MIEAGNLDAVPEEKRETLSESIAGLAFVLVIGLFVMTFLFQNFAIPSGSMEKTLLVGDHVLVDRVTLAPRTTWFPLVHQRQVQRGDVIVFLKPAGRDPKPDMILVKRAIGLPGDRIHLEHGILFRNGHRIDEPQISLPSEQNPYETSRDDFPRDLEGIASAAANSNAAIWSVEIRDHVKDGELVVPSGMVFAMGDNRVGSLDSRFWGFVPEQNLIGRPLFVYWSFVTPEEQEMESIGQSRWLLYEVTHFLSDTRWKRTLHLIS
ncbi:MAG: signal peptidase I [Janthinobacterium lividum]